MSREATKRARRAKSWLRQLSTTSESEELSNADKVYVELEARIRKTHLAVLREIFTKAFNKFSNVKNIFESLEDKVLQQHRNRNLLTVRVLLYNANFL